ncbi:MAG: tetratricopeptide repeat protein [Sphingomonadaceae bacterium]|nr:tetratricopeptide repeat protein [Sphingomonadaceae bacterium]
MNVATMLAEAESLFRNGLFAQAEQAFRGIAAVAPGNAEASFRLGIIAHQSGRFQEAHNFLRTAVTCKPDQPAFHYTLGLCNQDLNLLEEAAASFRQAIFLNPNFVQAYNNLGIVLQDLDQNDEAISVLNEALRRKPEYPLALNNLATVLRDVGRLDEAWRCLTQAVRLQPGFQRAHYNLGRVLMGLERHADAKKSLAIAISLDQRHAESHYFLGLCHEIRENFSAAVASFKAALNIDADYTEASLQLADLLARKNQTEAAIACYDHVLRKHPARLKAWLGSSLTLPVIYQNQEELDRYRQRYASNLEALRTRLMAPDSVHDKDMVQDLAWTNFLLAYQGGDDRQLQDEYGALVAHILNHTVPELMAPMPRPATEGRKVRIGYVSRFFRDCTAGNYFKGWIAEADKSQFELHVYSLDSRQDPVTREISENSDSFQTLTVSAIDAASKIRSDSLDIIVFPEVGMDTKTFLLANMRLASVQCAAWGHPMTTGLPNIDYYISCALMEPDSPERLYSENLCLLDGIGTCYKRGEIPTAGQRSDFGLPEGKTLYLFPQSLFKIHPDSDALIARILAADGEGVLVIFKGQQEEVTEFFCSRLGKVLQSHGLDITHRVVILPYVRHHDYQRINQLCDVMLDSLYWSGGHTSLDALACGLPVVTLPGAYMRGRQTAGMLKLAGVPELIATDTDAYMSIALRLAKDSNWRAHIKSRLAEGCRNIFDQVSPVRTLESFYRTITSSSAPT